MPFSRLSVAARFLLVLLIGFIFQAGISVISLLDLKRSMMQERTSEVKHLLDTGYSTLVYFHNQASNGRMTDEEARHAARDAVRAMHYDGNNYYFIWDLDGNGIAHGGNVKYEGKNFFTGPDAKTNPVVAYMVHRLINVARSPDKEGTTTYRIPKAGQTIPLDKLSYSRLFEPWGWSIGTGVYIDDIDETFRMQAIRLLWIFLGMFTLATGVTYFIWHDLLLAMRRLAVRIESITKGELDSEIPDLDRHDEVGVMARALLVLRDTSKEVSELKLDHLTGLPTRKLLMDRIRQTKIRSARSGMYNSLLLIDLDKFKPLNDTHGHNAGDQMLKEVAKRLIASVRVSDTVARLGGDEFIVLLADINENEAVALEVSKKIAGKIVDTLNQNYHLGHITHHGTASIGATLFKGNSLAADDLLKQADIAMYKSKIMGSNTCQFFETDMKATGHEQITLEKELRNGIAQKQFLFHYQSQAGGNGQLLGCEALLRWQHPSRGLLAPSEFLPLAEKTGLIAPLGQLALDMACGQLALWASHPELAALSVAVNVSSIQFRRPEFVEQVLAVLQRTGAEPHRLKLELSEHLLANNVPCVIEKMSVLKLQGVRFALDDFGRSYSSLSHLNQLPLNELKIERAFVHDVLTNNNDAAMAKMIVALAKILGLHVIAVGVETEAQKEFLSEAGCVEYQGYLHSHPLPVDEFELQVLKTKLG
ncbi:EAL domain-containing protein [Solimicrobium silvestre]|nr:EAL domain-containing protein [Solimicrobium silvestre]